MVTLAHPQASHVLQVSLKLSDFAALNDAQNVFDGNNIFSCTNREAKKQILVHYFPSRENYHRILCPPGRITYRQIVLTNLLE